MSDVDPGRSTADAGLRPAIAATRAQLGLVVILFGFAAVGWWWTTRQMRGMDNGPWTDLGTFGWFVGVWIVMMAAMMFPSVAPTVAGNFTWEHAGRYLTGATLLLAAAYELTPLKRVCLSKCRSPLGFLLGSWRDGWSGALRMGLRNGAWCVGCCWALMASLFALGIMSPIWMAVVAGLIAVEKILPWRRLATYGVTMVLFALGVLVIFAPDVIPTLTVPMHSMR